MIGATAVPQIMVGSPSPQVEPSAIGAGYRSLPFRPDVVIDGWSTEAVDRAWGVAAWASAPLQRCAASG